MCLAILARITRVENEMAIIDMDGVQHQASLLLPDIPVGDFVIVHGGFGIQKLDEEAAPETLRLLREAAENYDA